MKKQAILGLLVSIMSLSAFAERVPMVDVPTDEDIVVVDGKQQIVTIKGPSDLKETKAVLLKAVSDEDFPAIHIIGTNGVQNFFLGGNMKLSLTEQNQFNQGQETTLSTNEKGSLIVTLRNELSGPSRFKSDIYVAYRDGNFVVAGLKVWTADFASGAIKESNCEFNYLAGNAVVNGKAVKIKAKKVLFENLTDKSNIFSCKGL